VHEHQLRAGLPGALEQLPLRRNPGHDALYLHGSRDLEAVGPIIGESARLEQPVHVLQDVVEAGDRTGLDCPQINARVSGLGPAEGVLTGGNGKGE
jgi:hypothetical protein